jgi:uncharacterized protein
MNTQTNIDIDISIEDFDSSVVKGSSSIVKNSILMRVIRVFALTAGLMYGLICLMFICFQDSLIYSPTHKIERVPVHAGHSFMNLVLETEDHLKINAWYIPAPQNNGTVLFCRGNKGNLSDDLGIIESWNRCGYNILSFDYRGYGISQGTPSEDGFYKDARAAYKWLESKNLTKKRFLIHGHSIGGGVASKLAVEVDCDGLILESTFTSLKDLAQQKFPMLPTSLICFSDFPTINRLSSVKAPIYVIHSPEDKNIPFKMAKEIYDSANLPKMFLTLKGENQDFPSPSAKYTSALSSFANSLQARK